LPLYEYKCEKCGHHFEKIEPFSAATVKKCPKCGAKAERQISAAGIQFKGSGWYVTDYKGKSPATGTSENSGSDGGSSDSKSGDGKSAESTSDSKSDSKSETKSESKDSASKTSSEKSSGKKKK
jgi:putative FmdB family regulatory protein